MKRAKILLVILLQFIGFATGFAEIVTDEDARRYQASLTSYLKTEGYMPSEEKDGDIKIKYNDVPYWISVAATSDGYDVSLSTLVPTKDFDSANVLRSIDDIIRVFKYVRFFAIMDNQFVTVDYSWNCETLADFKRMFEHALSGVQMGRARLILYLKARN